jgi:hypothetical protein
LDRRHHDWVGGEVYARVERVRPVAVRFFEHDQPKVLCGAIDRLYLARLNRAFIRLAKRQKAQRADQLLRQPRMFAVKKRNNLVFRKVERKQVSSASFALQSSAATGTIMDTGTICSESRNRL